MSRPSILAEPEQAFRNELRELLNRASAENGSQTPDFILARYCLRAFDLAVSQREHWYGRRIP